MTLNIYTISHPIIQLLANSIINKTQSYHVYENNYKYLGFLFIYEILRKHIITTSLYIPNIYATKHFYLVNPKTKLYILTDLSTNYKMITDIKIIIPNIEIIHIEYTNNETMNNVEKIITDYLKIKIFILDEDIKNEKIIKLIEKLKFNKIPLQNVCITCITCYERILHKLNNIYPKLKIYTTKIIYNNK